MKYCFRVFMDWPVDRKEFRVNLFLDEQFRAKRVLTHWKMHILKRKIAKSNYEELKQRVRITALD